MTRLKPILFTLAALFGSFSSALAVPPDVETSFAAKYPEVTTEEWELDGNGYWEANFELDGRSLRADFTGEGDWVETEESIEFSDLPDAVQSAVKEEFGDEEISEVEKVDHSAKGIFYDVEFLRDGPNFDVEYDENGTKLVDLIEILQAPIGSDAVKQSRPEDLGPLELLFEFAVNILTIVIFAWWIYYRRHHDHQMLFLLFGFNLFLFPIFLLGASLTAGFGFTIFALLALVRMRSDTFSKTEVAYLLGAVALTFINALMPVRVEIMSSLVVLITAWVGDHPSIWSNAYHSAEIRYRLKDTREMLNRNALREHLAKEFQVEVCHIDIERVCKNEVRLVMKYRDLPENAERTEPLSPADLEKDD